MVNQSENSGAPAGWKRVLARPGVRFALAFLLFAVVVYHVALVPGQVLLTTDDNIGALAQRKIVLPYGFFGWWNDSILVGAPQLLVPSCTNLLLWIFRVKFFANWIHAFDLVVGSIGLGLFLRLRKRSWAACALAALTALWAGSTFTLTFAGHIGKFGVVMFAGLCLWLIELAVQRRSALCAVLAGGAMGGMFLEQVDVALFFSLVLGPYAIYAVLREAGRDWRVLARVVAPLVVVAGLLAVHPMFAAYTAFAGGPTGGAQGGQGESWDYCTQWSWPPEETIDFIAPGYTGWRSGEPEGPYWGRMGRSAGWEQTKQGFRNFRLETFYLGAIPLFFAFAALAAALPPRKSTWTLKGDVLFCAAAALVTYLLALGKFFPLYRLFFMLPGMSSIRNPVKFMQVTQLMLAILAAYGLDLCVDAWRGAEKDPARLKVLRRCAGGAMSLGAVFALIAMGKAGATSALFQRFNMEGWGPYTEAIIGNVIRAMAHAAALTLLVGGVGLFLSGRRRRSEATLRRAPWALVAIVAVDLLLVSRHYVQAVPMDDYVGESDLVRFLKQQTREQRALMFTQGDFYNLLLTYAFPYHGVSTFNVPQIRMTEDYQSFLDAVGNEIPRLASLAAIGTFLGPAESWMQIQQDERLKNDFHIIFAYNVERTPSGGVTIRPGTQEDPGRHVVLAYSNAIPRYALVGRWEKVPDDVALQRIRAGQFDSTASVMVSLDTARNLPDPVASEKPGSVSVVQRRPGRVDLHVSSQYPGILRLADKYSPAWKATVDGKPADLLRCDYLFQGVLVQPGLHRVALTYAPGYWTLWLWCLAVGTCSGAGALLFIGRLRSSPRRP